MSVDGHRDGFASSRTSLSDRLREAIAAELEHDEEIEWVGMPTPRFFTGTATGMFLFGLPWTAFTLPPAIGAAIMGGPARVIGVPFLSSFALIGVALLLAPVWAYVRSFRTAYVITDRRAITFDGGWSLTIRSYSPDKLTDVFRRENSDGSGDVIITHRPWRDSDGDRQKEELGFLRIPDVREVERKLKRLACYDAEVQSLGLTPDR